MKGTRFRNMLQILNNFFLTYVVHSKNDFALADITTPKEKPDSLSAHSNFSKLSLQDKQLLDGDLKGSSATLAPDDQFLALQHQITRILTEHASLETVVYQVIKLIGETLHLDYGAMWQVDEKEKVLRCLVTWHVEDPGLQYFAEISKGFIFPSGKGLPGRVWELNKSYWIKDLTLDKNFPRTSFAKEANLHSAFCVPIFFDNQVLGVFEFYTRTTYSLNDHFLRILDDINTQIGIFIDRDSAQKRIEQLSQSASMANLAGNALHNIGNSLNSINIAAEMIAEKIQQSKMENLQRLVELVQQKQASSEPLILDTKEGKNIIEFLSRLADEWQNEKQYLNSEIKFLMQNIENVKKIIITQQSLSLASGVTEAINVSDVLEDSLLINQPICKKLAIDVVIHFTPIKKAIVDRLKLFQIVDNLITNSIDALLESQTSNKQLTLIIKEDNADNFIIQVIDNGIGMASNLVTKIFTHGFTTKKSGHGFGLHASALYAAEMGGILFAETKGPGLGATFTLKLPYQPKPKGDNNELGSQTNLTR